MGKHQRKCYQVDILKVTSNPNQIWGVSPVIYITVSLLVVFLFPWRIHLAPSFQGDWTGKAHSSPQGGRGAKGKNTQTHKAIKIKHTLFPLKMPLEVHVCLLRNKHHRLECHFISGKCSCHEQDIFSQSYHSDCHLGPLKNIWLPGTSPNALMAMFWTHMYTSITDQNVEWMLVNSYSITFSIFNLMGLLTHFKSFEGTLSPSDYNGCICTAHIYKCWKIWTSITQTANSVLNLLLLQEKYPFCKCKKSCSYSFASESKQSLWGLCSVCMSALDLLAPLQRDILL